MKTKNTAKTETDLRTQIINHFVDYVLKEGKNPTSVYQFSKDMGMEESEFYTYFSSFEGISNYLWESMLEQTISRIEGSKEFSSFSVREKILAFYYTLIEELLKRRSYVKWSAQGWMNPMTKHAGKEAVTKVLEPFFERLISEGFENQELVDRKPLSQQYKKAMIFQFWFVLDFWIKDSSSQFEDTDAAIEKAVNLSFDLMKENTLDKAFDFAKFLLGRFQAK